MTGDAMNYGEYVQTYRDYNPGEHHLVAVYLAPLIHKISSRYPIYINPDGMKEQSGDLIYAHGDSRISIEVKLEKLCLTSTQCQSDYRPGQLLYFDRNGIWLSDWDSFYQEYIAIRDRRIREDGSKFRRYGPTVSIDEAMSMKSINHQELIATITNWFDIPSKNSAPPSAY